MSMNWDVVYEQLHKSNTILRDDVCLIECESVEQQQSISNFINVKHTVPTPKTIQLTGLNLIDFLAKLFAHCPGYSPYRENYLQLLGYQKRVPVCRFIRTDPKAVSPSKNFASDEGYDLWLISIDKQINSSTIRFETGIRVQPELGYHIEILPRSSLSNSGWMLSNSVGLIDASYSGTLKVCLTKVCSDAQDITLPFKAVQMVLRKSNHFDVEEVEKFDRETIRGSGGFGSTDKK